MMCKNCGMENAMPSDVNCWHCGKRLPRKQRKLSDAKWNRLKRLYEVPPTWESAGRPIE